MAGELITCWDGGGDVVAPKRCTCEVFGWPYRTTDGDQMFVNTHFLTEGAWECIARNVRAQVSSAASQVEEAKQALAKATQIAADACVRSAAVTQGFGRWKEANHDR